MEKEKREGEEYRKAGRTQIIQEIFLTGRAFLLGTWKDNLEMNLRLQESEKKSVNKVEKRFVSY